MNLDNYSYKDTYHFKKDSHLYSNPYKPSSLDLDPKINDTIKENKGERTNVEIEGNELVLQPDLTGLHKARGKKHSKGGMEVLLKPDTFVFSDDPKLAFNKKDHELFEFKEGGSIASRKNTPAEVLKRQVDAKHYNSLINNINDVKKDATAKKSSQLMLEKYLEKLGNVAYLQEAKKGFPTGVPSFSQGTAPVYDANVKNEVEAEKQYARFGGAIMQRGGINRFVSDGAVTDKSVNWGRLHGDAAQAARRPMPFNAIFPNGQMIRPGYTMPDTSNTVTPTGEDPSAMAAASLTGSGGTGKIKGTNNPYTVAGPNGHQLINWGLWDGDKLPTFKNTYGTNNGADKIANLDALSSQLGYKGPHDNKAFQEWLYNSSPENKAIIDKWHTQYKGTGPKDGVFDGKIGIRWQNALAEISQVKPQLPGNFTPGQNYTAPPAAPQGPTPNEVNTTPGNPIAMNTGFTPEQKIAQAYANAKYATAKRYMPYRSHFNASYVDANLMNPEQAVQDAQASTNAQIGALNSLNPMLRNAQAQSFAGQAFNQIAGIRSQYDNQNAQIINQNRAMNNQIRNNATGQNMQNDQQYYQQSVVGRQNYDQLRGFLADQAMNTRTQHVQENEQLGWNLLTQKNPVYGFDFKTGKMYRNPNVNIMDADMGNNYRDDLLETATKLKSAGWSDALIGNLLKSRAFSQAQYRPHKKGGRLANPYKK